MTLDELLRALDLLDKQPDLPPLLRQLALRGLLGELKTALPAQDELDFNDAPLSLAERGLALIRHGEAERQRGEQLRCLATLLTQLR
jgi:hypothetical protein